MPFCSHGGIPSKFSQTVVRSISHEEPFFSHGPGRVHQQLLSAGENLRQELEKYTVYWWSGTGTA